MSSREDVQAVSPALDAAVQRTLLGDLWKRPGLGPRDRSLITLAALIARQQTLEMPGYVDRALESGLEPGEISETILHLAYYAGFPAAMTAVGPVREAFGRHGIGADRLPAVSPKLLPLDRASEQKRAETVERNFGATAPGVVRDTTELLFTDLWLRPDLSPRDRSLVTISALIASGGVAQLGGHLERAMDNGLTEAEASAALEHLAFYAGWPNVFSALPIARETFEKRRR